MSAPRPAPLHCLLSAPEGKRPPRKGRRQGSSSVAIEALNRRLHTLQSRLAHSAELDEACERKLVVTSINRAVLQEDASLALSRRNAERHSNALAARDRRQCLRVAVLNTVETRTGLASTDPTSGRPQGAFHPATVANGGNWGLFGIPPLPRVVSSSSSTPPPEEVPRAGDGAPSRRDGERTTKKVPFVAPSPSGGAPPVYQPLTHTVPFPRLPAGGFPVPPHGSAPIVGEGGGRRHPMQAPHFAQAAARAALHDFGRS